MSLLVDILCQIRRMARIVSLPAILSVVCGQAPSSIVERHGHYLDWFGTTLSERVQLVPWFPQQQHAQPPLAEFSGVLITGSPATLTRPEPWMEVAVETIREAAEMQVPLLGVCFGHQLVGCAFGAPTTRAPENGELGSLALTLSDAGKSDPLFRDCPDSFKAHFSHQDQVDPVSVTCSNGLRVLASTDNTQVQALAGGDFIRSVQFHPEFDAALMSSYIKEEESTTAASEDCAAASKILDNWLEGWILKA